MGVPEQLPIGRTPSGTPPQRVSTRNDPTLPKQVNITSPNQKSSLPKWAEKWAAKLDKPVKVGAWFAAGVVFGAIALATLPVQLVGIGIVELSKKKNSDVGRVIGEVIALPLIGTAKALEFFKVGK